MNRPLVVSYTDMMDYGEAWDLQKKMVHDIDAGKQQELLLLLQHPPTYTIGTQRHPEHLLISEEDRKKKGISVYQIDRGGDITYHGPGQLVGYPIMFLGLGKEIDLHAHLRNVEEVFIEYLQTYGINAGRKEKYTGVWVGDLKICAIGIKFNRSTTHRRDFITSHGFAFNIKSGIQNEGFKGIIPCGIEDYGVTSLEDCTGLVHWPEQVASELVPIFAKRFGFDPIWTAAAQS
ncbi:lipoyl(octanoyl) transferase LipB [Paenibacillus sp. Marseille-Q4541]|uniref:lipoyl(octanoyl) transferase LipB n=1 Tax=Paenibacillus sp. Marseille-Q4541 TaxID=2831522 RepID=UPI001BA59329|nr:lipoyl(octanoyl) transferase LipB [Paenibacillus sp. Marseille-Q4541]